MIKEKTGRKEGAKAAPRVGKLRKRGQELETGNLRHGSSTPFRIKRTGEQDAKAPGNDHKRGNPELMAFEGESNKTLGDAGYLKETYRPEDARRYDGGPGRQKRRDRRQTDLAGTFLQNVVKEMSGQKASGKEGRGEGKTGDRGAITNRYLRSL